MIEKVNSMLNDIGTLLVNKQVRPSRYTGKPLFNTDCKEKRNEFHQAKNRYSYNKSVEMKQVLNSRAKEFKKMLKQNYSKYQEKCADEVRSQSKSDPKALWKVLNKYTGKKKENPSIPIDTFYEYFINLNQYDSNDNDMLPLI
jgi:hypothetical protein